MDLGGTTFLIVTNAVIALLGLNSALLGQATTAYSPPLGAIELVADGLRETAHGIPLYRTPVAIAELGEVAVDSVNDTEGNFLSRRLTFADSIGTSGQYNPDPETGELVYFAEFVAGDAAGQRLPIVGSGTNWIAVAEDPQGTFEAYFGPETVTPRDLIYIRPYWTLGTAMSSSDTSAYDSSDLAATRNGDAVLLPQAESSRDGRVFQKFVAATGDLDYWGEIDSDGALRLTEDDSAVLSLDAAAIEPSSVLKVRRSANSALSYVITGDATSLQAWSLPTPDAGALLEIPFSLELSDPVTLDQSGLTQLFTVASSSQSRQDEFIVWDVDAGFYARPAHRFYLLSASPSPIWREVGDDATDQGSFILKPGQGYLIRRRGF